MGVPITSHVPAGRYIKLQEKARHVGEAWRAVSNRLSNLFSMRSVLLGADAEIVNDLIRALHDLEREVE